MLKWITMGLCELGHQVIVEGTVSHGFVGRKQQKGFHSPPTPRALIISFSYVKLKSFTGKIEANQY